MVAVGMLRRPSERVHALSTRQKTVGRRAVKRAGRTIRGHVVCSRWSGPVTGSWGWVARRTIVSDPPKGLSKRHNDIDKDAFLEVLTNRRSGSGKNRGFRVRHSTVLTYVQERAALTYFYAKRVLHEDRVRTGPVDV